MKRIDIVYGGQLYSVGGRDLEELMDEIAEGVRVGGRWLRVNDGEGFRRDALLLLGPGIPIGVIPVPADAALTEPAGDLADDLGRNAGSALGDDFGRDDGNDLWYTFGHGFRHPD
ncbi:hypothetical protein [Microbacterium luticocti]|uniref:hypothetical protein n=1 Tax=Microbacterium luticocti TaxID=451764 RepID=UPI0004017B01|nr:hypothetical protein [Microbacterium luticocti]